MLKNTQYLQKKIYTMILSDANDQKRKSTRETKVELDALFVDENNIQLW